MIRAGILSILCFPTLALAYPADDLAGRTLECGKKTFKFSADTLGVTLPNGQKLRAQWNNGRIRTEADLGKDHLQLDDSGSWYLNDDLDCVVK